MTTTGVPAPTFSETGALPSGVTFVDNGAASLSGTPAAGTGGYALTITAANGVTPNATQSFTLTGRPGRADHHLGRHVTSPSARPTRSP